MSPSGAPAAAPQYMPAPAVMTGVPPGLEYLSQIDQLLVHQQIELLESQCVILMHCNPRVACVSLFQMCRSYNKEM